MTPAPPVGVDRGGAPARRITAGKLYRAVRPFTWPVSALPVLVATAAVLPPSQWRWGVLVMAAVGVALLNFAGNLLNDYFDFRSGVDRRVEGDENRPGRVLVRGELLPRDVLVEAIACLVVASGLGVALVVLCGPQLLWFGLAGVVGVYIYTGPPLQLKYRALGEPLIFLLFGPLLMTGAAWAQTGRFEMAALLLSIPVGMMTTAVLVGNNIRDREEDAGGRIRTLGQFAHGKVAIGVYLALVIGSVLGLFAAALAARVPVLLLAAPLGLLLVAKPISSLCRGQRLPDIDARTARFAGAMSVLIIVAYVLRDWLPRM